MSVPYVMALPEVLGAGSSTIPTVEIVGLGSLPLALAAGAGALGYKTYNKDMERLSEASHYSNRNADRLIRNIGYTSSRSKTSYPSTFPEGHPGSPTNPIQLGPVVVTATSGTSGTAQPQRRRGRKPAATPASSDVTSPSGASTSTAGGSMTAPVPNPPENNDSIPWYKKPWETSKNSPASSTWGRGLRNFGIRVPAYTGVAAPVLDLVGNVVGASREDENVTHQWTFPLTESRFGIEKGLLKLVGDQYSTKVPYKTPGQQVDTVAEVATPVDTFTRAPMVIPDTSKVRNGVIFVSE